MLWSLQLGSMWWTMRNSIAEAISLMLFRPTSFALSRDWHYIRHLGLKLIHHWLLIIMSHERRILLHTTILNRTTIHLEECIGIFLLYPISTRTNWIVWAQSSLVIKKVVHLTLLDNALYSFLNLFFLIRRIIIFIAIQR